jgi:hypothetical protein
MINVSVLFAAVVMVISESPLPYVQGGKEGYASEKTDQHTSFLKSN